MLVTMANIFANMSELGPWGWVAAIAAAGAALTSFISYQNKVKSIDNDYEEYAEGEEYVDKKNKYKQGKDTVPAMLTKGERVLSVDLNKKLGKMSNKDLVDMALMYRYSISTSNAQNFDDRPIKYLSSIDETQKKMYDNARKKYDLIPLGNNEYLVVHGHEKLKMTHIG